MREFEVKRAWISRSRRRGNYTPEELEVLDRLVESAQGMATVQLCIQDYPGSFWKAMLSEPNLTASLRTAICLFLFGMRSGEVNPEMMYSMEVDSPAEFGNAIQPFLTVPQVELNLNDRWYPVSLSAEFLDNEEKIIHGVRLLCTLRICDRSFGINHTIYEDHFRDAHGSPTSRTVLEILEQFGYRRLQTTPSEFNLRLVKAERFAAEYGKLVEVGGSVLVPAKFVWWRGYEIHKLGTPEKPSRCIVESALEVHDDSSHFHFAHREKNTNSRLPFVRLFCLETKTYVYADVDDVAEYQFEQDALSRLHLPKDMHSVLSRVFDTPVDEIFGDLLRGKHGGVVVLASGSPGVGKTLTAEIYAEITQRPLYVLELGELGTEPTEVEENLQLVFARVTRWNAVLQFDECEIFLAQRGTDLKRSAIVGIFLRLLDYYRGLLFLTTNRPDVLDEAVLSRVMLRMKYPDLDEETRANVWRTMFEQAGLSLKDCDFDYLAKHELNGRQIRNLTRLAQILNPSRTLNQCAIDEVLEFGCPRV